MAGEIAERHGGKWSADAMLPPRHRSLAQRALAKTQGVALCASTASRWQLNERRERRQTLALRSK